MRLSKYINYAIKGEKVVAISLLTKCVVEFTKQEFENLKLSKNELFDKATINYLLEKNILTDLKNEEDFVYLLLKRDMLSPISLSTYIMFTESCNFSCVYCYQKGQVKGKAISRETLDKICLWHEKTLTEKKYEYCNIELYGGEPLIEKELLIYFSSKMYDICSKIGVKLNLRLITNGFLMDKDTIQKLSKCGLRDIHLSIDGWGATHDKRRPLRCGLGSFNTILENYLELKDLCHFTIRTGFDKDNLDDIEEFIKNISKILGKNELYFAPIYNTLAQSKNACSYCSKNSVLDLEEMIRDYKLIYFLMKKYGIKIPNFISSGPCMLGAVDACIFDTEGKIFKCVDMIGIDELQVGEIERPFNDLYFKLVKNQRLEKCMQSKCKYVSICGGGCAMKNFTLNQNVEDINCEKVLFDELNKYLLELNFLD